MFPNNLPRYISFSTALHAVLIAWLLVANLFQDKEKNYYAVDLAVSFPSGKMGGAPPKPEPAKTISKPVERPANPKEDIIIPQKKKPAETAAEKKSEISPVPSVPGIPSAPSEKNADANAWSEVPGLEAGSGVGIGFGGGAGSGSGNFPYVWYVSALQKKLDANWNVDSGFSKRIFAQVVFVIQRNGSLTGIEIEKSSRNDVFDKAALRAVEYTNPLAPLPSGFQESNLRVHVRFSVKN